MGPLLRGLLESKEIQNVSFNGTKQLPGVLLPAI
jgi:hypothetical protein